MHSKKNFESNFLAPCFDIPKTGNFTSSGVENCEIKTRRMGMIVTSFQDFKSFAENGFLSYFLIRS